MKDLYPAREDFSRKAWIDKKAYEKLYSESTKDPDAFWTAQAERIHWYAPWHTLRKVDYASASIEWYLGGKTNGAYNCIDRHLTSERRDKTAIIWEGDNPEESQRFSYSQLHEEVSLRANLLKKYGVKKGDRVVLYMPMIPDLAFFCLACSRIGAVHSVVFGGFSAEALKRRIHDCAPVMLITADGGFRGGKTIQLKAICDKALEESSVQSCLVVRRTGENVAMKSGRDTWLHEAMSDPDLRAPCPPEEMDAEDPLFILYTSGSTGNPKGILHTTGGYLVYASLTHQYIFDYHEEDVYWCTADIGWITGHSYGIYGPLCNGATTLLFEGVPNYPDWGRFWDICDKHSVSIFYTAPTAIRALAKEGDDFVRSRKRETLRVLGSVGEPIHPETWEWYHRVVGNERCPIVDTWWQTETGGILISPLPGATDLKPGSATKPFLGIEPAVVNVEGEELTGESTGFLCIKTSWPGQARGIYGNKDMFFTTYFSQFKGYYYTGDGCRRDADGYYWVTGRVDDVINVSGHRLGSAEIEAAIMEHESVAEAAVIGVAHDIKGQGIYAYVALNSGISPSEGLKDAVRKQVRTTIGPIATPETIQWAQGLPKTRSGKIMRRILRKIAEHQEDSIGDVSTLADPSVVAALIEARARAADSRAGSNR